MDLSSELIGFVTNLARATAKRAAIPVHTNDRHVLCECNSISRIPTYLYTESEFEIYATRCTVILESFDAQS